MRRLILILILSATLKVFGQSWAPIGATWHYQSFDIFMDQWYAILESIGDTTIQGKDCKILSSNGVGACTYGSEFNPIFIYPDTDKVYYFNQDSEEFYILYDFTKVPGDTFYIPIYSMLSQTIDSVGFYIDSLGFTDIDTLHLRTQYLTPIQSGYYTGHTGEIIEFIGHTSFLFPIDMGACDISYTFDLLCYNDSIIEYHNPNLSSSFCSTIGIGEISTSKRINIFPNPTQDIINIDIDKSVINKINLYDIYGRLIMTSFKTSFLDLSPLTNGLYIIEITYMNNNKIKFKIIKNAS